MNIALVVPGGVDRSGERRVIPALLALIRRLAREHEVQVFAQAQEAHRGSWPLHGATVHNAGRPFAAARIALAIRRAHRRRPFDIVHCLWSGTGAMAGVAAARSLGIPALVHIAGGELVWLPDIAYGGAGGARRLLNVWPLRHADRVTAASLPIIELAATFGIAAERVPLGVDLDVWPAREARRRAPGEMARLVHVASLNRVKDQATLLAALGQLASRRRDFHLDVVGEDTLAGEIHGLAQRLGLESQVTFHGFRTQRELRPIIEAAHAHIVSSRHEAGPLVALEAAVAGVPSVGTAVGHLREWAPDAALTVAPGDAAGLAMVIARVLDDEDLRLALAVAAARIAIAEDADHTARSFIELYRRVQ